MERDWIPDENFEFYKDLIVPDRTDAELLEILSNKDQLKEINKREGPAFFNQLFTRMVESEEFLKRVNEILVP